MAEIRGSRPSQNMRVSPIRSLLNSIFFVLNVFLETNISLDFPFTGLTLLENDQKRIFTSIYGYICQNFIPHHQILLGYSIVRQVLPYSRHLGTLFLLQTEQKWTFCVFLCEFGGVLVRFAGIP